MSEFNICGIVVTVECESNRQVADNVDNIQFLDDVVSASLVYQ